MVAVRREWMVGGSSRAPPLRAGPRSARTPRAMKPMPGERERGWNAHLLERLHPVVDPDILAKPSPEELRHGAPRASQTRASATLPRRAVLCPALESRGSHPKGGDSSEPPDEVGAKNTKCAKMGPITIFPFVDPLRALVGRVAVCRFVTRPRGAHSQPGSVAPRARWTRHKR